MKLFEIFSLLDDRRELLFELRNVVNVDQLKNWAKSQGDSVADNLMVPPEVYEVIRNWAQKALLKYAVKNAHAEPLKGTETGTMGVLYNIAGHVKTADEIPAWAQQALQRGEEVVSVDPNNNKDPAISPASIRLVRDFLRFKYQQNPREFTVNRLARIPWVEAVRLTTEYHAELDRKRPRSMNEMIDWYIYNEDAQDAFNVQVRNVQNTMLIRKHFIDILEDRERGVDQTYRNVSDYLGAGFNILVKIFKKATGFSVELPKDDPSGREAYLRYDDKGAILPPEPEKEPDPYLRMDWQDEDGDGAQEVQDKDFERAEEVGPGWYKLRTSKCVEYEGAMMGHCVGGYGDAVESGKTLIYSLRDKNNEPHVTIELAPQQTAASISLEQIKGKENEPPVAKYREQVIDFLKKIYLTYDDVHLEGDSENDLFGLSIINQGDRLDIIDPPFEPKGFWFSENVYYWDEENEEFEEPQTMDHEDNLSLVKALDNTPFDETFLDDILDTFLRGEPIWQSDTDSHDWETNDQVSHSIGYGTEEEKGYNLKPRKIARTIGGKK